MKRGHLVIAALLLLLASVCLFVVGRSDPTPGDSGIPAPAESTPARAERAELAAGQNSIEGRAPASLRSSSNPEPVEAGSVQVDRLESLRGRVVDDLGAAVASFSIQVRRSGQRAPDEIVFVPIVTEQRGSKTVLTSASYERAAPRAPSSTVTVEAGKTAETRVLIP